MHKHLVSFLLLAAVAIGGAARAQQAAPTDATAPVLNPALEDHEVPILQRELTPQQFRAWVTHPPSDLADAESARVRAQALQAPTPQFANQAVGDIFVVEGNTSLVLSINQNGTPCSGSQCYKVLNHQGGAVESIANALLASVGDHFDMIVVWTTFEDYSGGAYYAPLKNDTYGLGKCQQGGGQDLIFGCVFGENSPVRAQGLIFMNSIEMWKMIDQQYQLAYDEDDFDSQIYSTLGQESAHRWLVGFHFEDPATNDDSTALLGRDRSHWNLKVDAEASVMDGLNWTDDGNGNFRIIGDNDTYSPLDLYAMGLAAKEEVPPFFLVEEAYSQRLRDIYRQFGQSFSGYIPDGNDELFIPPHELVGDITATGTRKDITIDMITEANGERFPTVEQSQKEFKQAFVLVTLPGQRIPDSGYYLDRLDLVRRNWERWFSEKTGGRGRMCTSLSGQCAVPLAEIRDLRFSDANSDADGQWKRGETAEFFVSLGNNDGVAIPSVNATISALDSGVVVEQGGAQLMHILGNTQVEAGTPFRVRLEDGADCGLQNVRLKVTLDPVGSQPDGREFSFPITACENQGGSSSGGFGPFGGGGPLAAGPCACSTSIPGGLPVVGLALLGLLWRRRR